MSAVDVSVTIATWNGQDLLARCLDSLAATAGAVTHEVIVVDNASADGTRAMVRERYPAVTLVESPDNEGYASANGRALQRARGRYVLVLNNDVTVFPDTLARMVAFMDRSPRVGASICALWPSPDAPGPAPCTGRYFPTARRILFENLLMFSGLEALFRRTSWTDLVLGYPADLTREHRVEHISGAFLFVRRETIDQVGPMDPGYFLYLEETDWCFRMRRAGWEIAYTPEARAVHIGAQSTGRLADRAAIYRQSMERYLRKHHGLLSVWAYRLEVLLVERPLTPLFRLARRLAGRPPA